jgi:hypothetical protein
MPLTRDLQVRLQQAGRERSRAEQRQTWAAIDVCPACQSFWSDRFRPGNAGRTPEPS